MDMEKIIAFAKGYAAAELIKIISEIKDYDVVSTNGNKPDAVFYITRNLCIEVIETHLSELKGE